MADSAALGTFMVEFDADPSKFEAGLGQTEKLAADASKDIENALSRNTDRAFRALKRSYDATWADIKAGGKGADAAVTRHTRNLDLWRQKVEKNSGSIAFATAEDQAQYAELETQLKKLRAEAEKQRPVKLPKSDSGDVKATFALYEEKYNDLQNTVAQGNPQMVEEWKKLVGVQVASVAAVKAKYGEISKATPREIQLLKNQEQQVKTLETRIRAFNAEYRRRTASMTGFPTNMGDALKHIASGYGAIGQAAASAIGKATIITALAVAAAAAIAKAVAMINSSDTNAQWGLWLTKAKRQSDLMKKQPWEWVYNMRHGEFGVPMDGGVATKRTGLFAPPVDPRTGKTIGTQAYRLQGNIYRANLDPALPTLKALEFKKRDLQGQMKWGWDHPITPVELEQYKDLDAAYRENALAIDAVVRADNQRITQLDLERAQMTNNKKAISDLSVNLDEYTAEEMKAAGVAPGVISATMATTKANRVLSFSIRDLAEEMETLSLQQSLAEFDSNFDEQRRLTKEMGVRALTMAGLTGKSDEYVAATKRQIAQQLRAIEIARIQRHQETIGLQQESAQARGNIDRQKSLAAEYSRTAVEIAELENRSRDYIAALEDLGVITQAQIEQERIARSITLAQSLLELTSVRDGLSTTNLYADSIASLTNRIDELTIARLRASVDPLDHELADIAQTKLDLRPDMQLAQYNLVRIGLDREYAAMHLAVQENLRNAERFDNEQRIRDYRAMVTQNVITAQQGDALIAQSRALLDQKMRDIDASYGRDWERWAERLAIKYEDEYSSIGDVVERIADNSKALLADGLFIAITEGLDGLEDAFKNFGLSVLRELTNILASRAMAQLLSIFATRGVATSTGAIGSFFGSSGTSFFPSGGVTGSLGSMSVAGPTGGFGSSLISGRGLGSESSRSSIDVEPGGRHGTRPSIDNHVTVMLAPEFMSGIISAAAQAATPSDGRIVMVVGRNILENGTLRSVIRNVG